MSAEHPPADVPVATGDAGTEEQPVHRGGVNDMLELVLGWSNPETAGGESLRLYALDAGDSPRWDKSLGDGGRTAERALIHASTDGQHGEGDRYLLIRLGDRFSDADMLAEQIAQRLVDATSAAGTESGDAGPEVPTSLTGSESYPDAPCPEHGPLCNGETCCCRDKHRECCFGTGVEADPSCPVHGEDAGERVGLSEHERADLLLAHHDGLCPEGADCRSRWLHAQSTTICASLTPSLLATFDDILAGRLAAVDPGQAELVDLLLSQAREGDEAVSEPVRLRGRLAAVEQERDDAQAELRHWSDIATDEQAWHQEAQQEADALRDQVAAVAAAVDALVTNYEPLDPHTVAAWLVKQRADEDRLTSVAVVRMSDVIAWAESLCSEAGPVGDRGPVLAQRDAEVGAKALEEARAAGPSSTPTDELWQHFLEKRARGLRQAADRG